MLRTPSISSVSTRSPYVGISPTQHGITVDYVCPFSAKIAIAIDKILRPSFAPGGAYAGKVKVIFRQHVQPWHGSSTFVHEAGLAVRSERSTVKSYQSSFAIVGPVGCPRCS